MICPECGGMFSDTANVKHYCGPVTIGHVSPVATGGYVPNAFDQFDRLCVELTDSKLALNAARKEADRLRAENKALVSANETWKADYEKTTDDADRLRARIAELEGQMVAVLGALEELTHWPQDSRLTYYVKTTLEAPPMAVQPEMVGGVFESMEERATAMLPWAAEQLAEARKVPGLRTALAAAQQDSEQKERLNNLRFDAAVDELVEVKAKLAAAQQDQDSERIDWLWSVMNDTAYLNLRLGNDFPVRDFRAAIDAARGGEG